MNVEKTKPRALFFLGLDPLPAGLRTSRAAYDHLFPDVASSVLCDLRSLLPLRVSSGFSPDSQSRHASVHCTGDTPVACALCAKKTGCQLKIWRTASENADLRHRIGWTKTPTASNGQRPTILSHPRLRRRRRWGKPHPLRPLSSLPT